MKKITLFVHQEHDDKGEDINDELYEDTRKPGKLVTMAMIKEWRSGLEVGKDW